MAPRSRLTGAAVRRELRALARARTSARRALRGGLPVSPLAPKRFPEMAAVAGVRLATGRSGTRYRGRDDLLLVELAAGTTLAGVTTRSATRSAAVEDVVAKLAAGAGSGADRAAFLVNAGNANAFTGGDGARAVTRLAGRVAEGLGLPASRVFTASTGVIGEPLEDDAIGAALTSLIGELAPGGFAAAAGAIRTTDTFAKGSTAGVMVAGRPVRICGIAKGSGMIAPDMATMLAFVFTDAALPTPVLAELLAEATAVSFNRITVDGDTSTSDTVLLAATGQSGAAPAEDPGDLTRFGAALQAVMADLATQIVRDGEGARKFVTVKVAGAASDGDAARIARAVADSPLVKTAVAGEDANWGRVVMAVGKAGGAADRDRLAIRFGPHAVAHDGLRVADYDEATLARYMRRPEIEIGIDLGLGAGTAEMWTCDLTEGYIRINADYRS